MIRYSKSVGVLAALLAVALALVATPTASAGCPGCDEYILDPPDDGGDDPAPAPAPVPTAPAPVAPVVPTTPTATVPVAPEVVEEPKPKKPVDTDPDPVPAGAAVKPVELASVPAIAASQARRGGGAPGSDGGLLPLALGMAAVAIVAALFGIRGRRPDAAPTGEDRSAQP